MDKGTWRAATCSVTKSWTRLKRLSMHTRAPYKHISLEGRSGLGQFYMIFLYYIQILLVRLIITSLSPKPASDYSL